MKFQPTREQQEASAQAAELLASQADGLRKTGSVTTVKGLTGYVDTLRRIASSSDLVLTAEEKVDVDYVKLSPADLMNDPSIVVTDEDVQTLYESEKKSFVSAERRRASHILLETGTKRSVEDAEATLRSVKERVAKGESFADLAKQLSEDPGSAAQGGDLGHQAELGRRRCVERVNHRSHVFAKEHFEGKAFAHSLVRHQPIHH